MGDQPTGQPDGGHARQWALLAVVGLAGLIAYLPQCRYDFVYDDTYIISQNPIVRGGAWWRCLAEPYWPPNLGTDPLYRPITTLSLRLDYAMFGDQPGGYRATNALLHSLCSVVTALLAVRLWRSRRAGWVAGLLFAAHPVHAEAVSMVVGRAELLAALFSIMLIYRHVGYLDGPRVPSAKHHLISALLLLLAVGSKEHAVLAAGGIVCLDLWARGSASQRSSIRERANRLAASHYLGLILAATAFFFVRWLIFGGRTTLPPDQVNVFANPLIDAATTTRLAVPPALLLLSLRLLAVPIGLCPIWSVGGLELPQTFWRADVLAGAALAVAVLFVVGLGLRRRWRAAVPVVLAGLFLILPCHFLPAANWLFAERWLYVPSVFLIVLVAGLGRYRRLLPVFAVIAAVLFVVNWRYQRCWQNTDDLMQAVVERHPYSYHGLIGCAYRMKLRDKLPEAEPYIARLMERFPDSPRTWYYQALLMDHHNHPQKVLEAVTEFVRLNGPNPVPADLEAARSRAVRMLEGEEPPGH